MRIHTVFIAHNRLELTKQAIDSYLRTVTVPHTLVVVDNASTDGTQDWLVDSQLPAILLEENRYPGYATNRGWEQAPSDATFLHRADNDFEFLHGWSHHAWQHFHDATLGQLGLRTDKEENWNAHNTGGNCIIRRELWDQGLRWDERPWPEIKTPGYSEDSYFSPEVVRMGYRWGRVTKRCILSLASGDWKDPYYQKSYGDRGIVPHPDDPTVPGTS